MIDESILATELLNILKHNSPVRDGSKYPGARGSSPYPGNLRNNGIRLSGGNGIYKVEIGGKDAPYALYTETRSRKKNWIKNSFFEFISKLESLGAEKE